MNNEFWTKTDHQLMFYALALILRALSYNNPIDKSLQEVLVELNKRAHRE